MNKLTKIETLIRTHARLKKKRPYVKRRPYQLSHFDPDILIRMRIWAKSKDIKIWEAVQYFILAGMDAERKKTGKTTRDILIDEIRKIQKLITKGEKMNGSDTKPGESSN